MVDPTRVGPSTWDGSENPLKSGPQRPPAQKAETTTVASPGPVGPVRPEEKTGRALVVKPAAVAPSRRKRNKSPKSDDEMVFADVLPEPKVSAKSMNRTQERLRKLLDNPGQWARLRVFASKASAHELIRRLNKPDDDYTKLINNGGTVEARMIPSDDGYAVWTRYNPTTHSTSTPSD